MSSVFPARVISSYSPRTVERWRSSSRIAVLSRSSKGNREISRSGWRIVALVRLSPFFPFALVSYAFGLSSISLHSFLLGLIGSIPAVLALVYTGSVAGKLAILYFRQETELGSAQLWAAGLGVAASILLLLMLFRFVNRSIALVRRSDKNGVPDD